MPTTLRVACASDANYVLPLAVMLASLAAHVPDGSEIEVFALDDGIPDDAKVRITRAAGERARIHWTPAGDLPANLVTWGRMTLTTYHKLTIGHWVPCDTGRVLWLDADLLIRADPTPLGEMPFDGALALAAVDERFPTVSVKGGVAAWRELGLPALAPHFNAGVLAIDLEAWRRQDIAARAFEYLRTYADRVYFWDQEALNAVLANQWRVVDPRWNRCPGLPGAPPPEDAFILHFSGNLKPWTYFSKDLAWIEYYGHLDRTPWAGWRPPSRWRDGLTARYLSSRLRRVLYPAEGWAMRLIRSVTATHSRGIDRPG